MPLVDFMLQKLREQNNPGLEWVDEDNKLFRVPFINLKQKSSDKNYDKIYIEYAEMKNKNHGTVSKYKINFRNALNKMFDFRGEQTFDGIPCRVYCMVKPNKSKKSDSDPQWHIEDTTTSSFRGSPVAEAPIGNYVEPQFSESALLPTTLAFLDDQHVENVAEAAKDQIYDEGHKSVSWSTQLYRPVGYIEGDSTHQHMPVGSVEGDSTNTLFNLFQQDSDPKAQVVDVCRQLDDKIFDQFFDNFGLPDVSPDLCPGQNTTNEHCCNQFYHKDFSAENKTKILDQYLTSGTVSEQKHESTASSSALMPQIAINATPASTTEEMSIESVTSSLSHMSLSLSLPSFSSLPEDQKQFSVQVKYTGQSPLQKMFVKKCVLHFTGSPKAVETWKLNAPLEHCLEPSKVQTILDNLTNGIIFNFRDNALWVTRQSTSSLYQYIESQENCCRKVNFNVEEKVNLFPGKNGEQWGVLSVGQKFTTPAHLTKLRIGVFVTVFKAKHGMSL